MSTIIEFTGLPNSGKTTILNELAKLLPREGISVTISQEAAEIVPDSIPKKTWDRNLWTTFHCLRELTEMKYAKTDVILVDRGFYDAVFWMEYMVKNNMCSTQDYQKMREVLSTSVEMLGIKPNYLILIDCTVEESLRRRYAQKGLPPVYSTQEFLVSYREKLHCFFNDFIDLDRSYINTTGLSIVQMVEFSKNNILEILPK